MNYFTIFVLSTATLITTNIQILKMKKFLLLVFASLLAISSLQAQHKINRLNLEMRGDWQFDSGSGEPGRINNSGFEGKFMNFRMDGSLTENLTYSFRYRINKVQANPWAATDWATINYSTDKWELSTGKQVVAIGGYEYDRAPIDIYFASDYWHQIACYQFGVSAAYKFGDKYNSKLLGQLCQSPYAIYSSDLYAYNLMYMSDFSLSSVNMLEYAPGKFVGYLTLGLRETFDKVTIELDNMYRKDLAVEGSNSFSAMLDVNWAMNEKLNLFAHGSYDTSAKVLTNDLVIAGADVWCAGGGAEYFPLGTRELRIHAATCYVFGNHSGSTLRTGDFMFQVGVTWRLNLVK